MLSAFKTRARSPIWSCKPSPQEAFSGISLSQVCGTFFFMLPGPRVGDCGSNDAFASDISWQSLGFCMGSCTITKTPEIDSNFGDLQLLTSQEKKI